MTEFKPHRIDIKDIRPGDGVHCRRSGPVAFVLAHLIHWLKEPSWKMEDWHLMPVVYIGTPGQIDAWAKSLGYKEFKFSTYADTDAVIVDAQFPRVKLSLLSAYLSKDKIFRAYRVVPVPPPQWKVDKFVKDHVGRRYDFIGYLWNGLAKLLRPRFDIPRVIDLKDYCWEVLYDFYESVCKWDPADGTDYDYWYPDICDLRRAYGEIPLKVR
jgi:hypothetical protein